MGRGKERIRVEKSSSKAEEHHHLPTEKSQFHLPECMLQLLTIESSVELTMTDL